MFSRSAKYPSEVRERAVRLVAEVRPAYESDQAAINAVAGILGIDSPNTLRKWIRRARINPGPGDPSNRNVLKRSLFRSHTIVIGSIITVLGGLGLAYSQQFFGIGQQSPTPSIPHLETDQVSLSYVKSAIVTDPTGFEIDIKLLNTGPQPAAINTARLVIQQFAVLSGCDPQGTFDSTGSYQANLPTDPLPGQVVNIPVSQLVPAGGADRFDLLLYTNIWRKPVITSLKKPSPAFNIYLYRIHVYLTYNINTKPLDIGEILVNSPDVPTAGEYFLDKYWAAHPSEFTFTVGGAKYASVIKACDIRNSLALHSMLSLPAMRTAELSAIEPQLAY
jgi:hypothetical protein